MEPGQEVDAPATDDPTPQPIRVEAMGGGVTPAAPQVAPASLPTPEALLQAIAAADGPWFPSRHAADAGVPRDSLDEPLAELRLAELIRVAEWVKGSGQGYLLTPTGQSAAANPAELERLKQAARAAATAPAAAPPAKAKIPPEIEFEGRPDPAGDAPPDADLTLRPPLVVPALLMTNALWFFVCVVVGIRWGLTPSRSLSEGHPDVLHRFGAVSGTDLLAGEWWRLVTSCFVHIGVLHLIGNLFALAMMGPLAELLWGRSRLLLIYLISGLAGSALAMALRPDLTLAGASGAIWGVQMSLFAWLFAFRRHLPPDLAGDWFRRLGVVFVLNAGVSFLPGVSWEAHLGGGVAGFLTAGLLNAARFGDPTRKLAAWLLIALLPVLCVSGLVSSMGAKGMSGWQHLRDRVATEQEREQRQKILDAQAEYNAQVAPRLARLAPEAVKPTELEAGFLLARTKRPPERGAALRARVEALKAAADEVAQFTTREPTGTERLDRQRERAKAFAAARSKSLSLLLAMLESAEPPRPETWAAWQAARRESDRLWDELRAK